MSQEVCVKQTLAGKVPLCGSVEAGLTELFKRYQQGVALWSLTLGGKETCEHHAQTLSCTFIHTLSHLSQTLTHAPAYTHPLPLALRYFYTLTHNHIFITLSLTAAHTHSHTHTHTQHRKRLYKAHAHAFPRGVDAIELYQRCKEALGKGF